ncbi:hypothetical protein [Variovorax sp. J22R115]|uniref:hypothetical protein n=1 Tax=Variovorax sp. J22R115 TaxID=3053509 RepID=UPI002574E676|nr:hypothetical protein [Variovorax sp. J22R115]MDM0053807.1 hypothetical protein [Variovorax sp. J22R115]
MRTPEVAERALGAILPAARQPKPPGGKVLARLRDFELPRGLTLNPVAPGSEAEVQPLAQAGEGHEMSVAAAVEARAAAAKAEEVGQLYADAAQGLNAAAEPNADQAGPGARADPAMESMVETAPGFEAGPGELTPPVAGSPQWRSLGPTMMPNGQTYGSSRTTVSGRVSCIAVDPGNGNHLLCGSAGGGVWESFDNGANWAPRTDFAPTLTVGALAFARSAPATVYCGTGEGNFYASLGAGVLKSINGGTTWTLVAGAPFVGRGFFDLAVDPANANHLLAASNGGLHESSDGGVTWTMRRNVVTWSLAIQPSGGATAEVLAACSDGVFRSINGGTTWAAVALPGAPASWRRLAVSMVRSDSRVAYAWGSGGGAGRLYRRDASGVWTAAATLPAGINITQDWYDWCLQAAPDRDNQVYIGAVDNYRGDLSGTTWTWTALSAKTSGDSIHPDQHAFALHPTDANVLFAGNDGGLFRSPNRGLNWTHLNNGMVITEIEYLAQDFGSVRMILGGTQDNGSIRYTGSPVWEHAQDGDGGDCGINRANPQTCFHTFFNMGMERSTTGGGFGSWGWIGPNVPAGYVNLFYPPVECNNDTVAMAGSSVYISRNRGTSFADQALPASQLTTAMHAPTPDRLYAGMSGGRIFRFDWSGAVWTRTELTSPRAASISDIHVESGSPNRLWVTLRTLGGGRVYSSADGGTSWTDRSAGLPLLPINAVCTDPGDANRVWVAADLGVFQSLNGGANWTAFSNGLPNVLVADLIFHPHARVLRAGTRNRGVWEIPVDGWMTVPICGTQFTGSLAPNASGRWFTFNWPATWHVVWTVMPTNVLPGAPAVTLRTQVERASSEFVTYWLNVTNLTASTVQFEGRFAILSKY